MTSSKEPAERAERAEISKRILDALERVKNNAPLNAELKKRAMVRPIGVNPSTVSLEAGVSRTLIGHDGCNYPEERQAVLKAARPSKRAVRLEDKSKRQAETLAVVLNQLRERDTIIATLMIMVSDLEGQLGKERSQERWTKKDKRKRAT